ncbi:unnamed protein product [Calypogeia fissa]
MISGDVDQDVKTMTKKNAHILIVTIAFSGHFGPFVQLMYHLEAKHPGMKVTVMGNKDRISDVANLQSKGDLTNLDLHLEEVFGPVPVYADDPKFPVRPEPVSHNNFAECEALRKKLISEKHLPGGPTAIISDMFQYWSKDLADELDVPWYTYFSVSPMFAVTIVEVPKILKAGIRPGYPAPNSNARLPAEVPELTPVPGRSFVRIGDLPEEFTGCGKFFEKVSERTIRATAVLLNASEELDSQVGAVAGLRTLLDSSRVLTIGPTLQFPGFGFVYAPPDLKSKCLAWLDSRREKSVLYIAFGTLGAMSKEEILELAAGVEASGVPFLWALKTGSMTLEEVLPPGFVERTKERGLIETGWVPQSMILSHPSTGGFLSHCGWNSILESICAGVPFVAWPLSADQPMNARYLAEIKKVGFAVCHLKAENQDNFENITRHDVEKAVRNLMLEETGAEVRRNIGEMQKSAIASVVEGGSSFQNLHTLLDELANA